MDYVRPYLFIGGRLFPEGMVSLYLSKRFAW